MKITIYNAKGWAWKTPIAANIILDTEYALGVNEPYTLYEGFIPKERLLAVDLSEPFPEIAENIDIVFDLGGSISRNSHSIVSAIQQSDIVIIPIHDERKSIHSGIMTISEVLRFNQNILIVATKLRKNATESWEQCGSIKNIKTEIQKELNIELPTLPLKLSTAFDTIFDSEKSIRQLVELWWLYEYHFNEVNEQFDKIYSLIHSKNEYQKWSINI